MQASELRDLDDEALTEQLEELQQELFNLRFLDATGQLDNPRRLTEVRRDIARAKPVLRERELATDSGGGDQ